MLNFCAIFVFSCAICGVIRANPGRITIVIHEIKEEKLSEINRYLNLFVASDTEPFSISFFWEISI